MALIYETFDNFNQKTIASYHKDRIIVETYSSNWHKPVEILYVESGEGKILNNFTTYDVSSGDIIVVNSKAIHQLSSMKEMSVCCLIVDDTFCSANGISLENIYFIEKIHNEKVTELYKDIIEELSQNDSYHDKAIFIATLRFMIYLARNYSTNLSDNKRNDTNSIKYQRIRNTIDYIENHFNEKLTIDAIAENVHISKYYLSHEFKRITGKTINEMITSIRCNHAQHYLTENSLTATEISDICGFETYAYFSNVFKRTVGFSPSEYRRHIQDFKS